MTHNDDLSAALRALPAPEPGPDLFDRIVRSRAMGRGRHLKLQEREFVFPWRWVAAAAVVSVLIGGSWVVSLSLSRLGSSPRVREPFDQLLQGVWPPRTMFDTRKTPQPKYALITSEDLDVTRLHDGVWMYTQETTTDDILTQRTGDIAVRLARTLYQGRPAWMVNTAKQLAVHWDQFGDTAYLDPTSLRPQEVIAY